MTDQQSSHAANTAIVGTYYSKRFFKEFEPQTFYYSLAPVMADMPNYQGKTINFDFFKKIPYLKGDDSDQFTAQQLYQSASVVTATLHERDGYVQLSRYLAITARNNIMERAYENIKQAAVKTLDVMIRNDIGMMVADVANASSLNFANMAIDGGSLYSTGITARVWSHDGTAANDRFSMYHDKKRIAQSALVSSFAKSGLTVRSIMHGVSVLEGKDVPPVNGSGKYILITHPTAAYNVTTAAGGLKGWISPTSSEPMRKTPSQLGIVGGAQVYTTTLAYRFPLSGDTLSTASGALFCSLLFGQDAYGCVNISEYGSKGFKLSTTGKGCTFCDGTEGGNHPI